MITKKYRVPIRLLNSIFLSSVRKNLHTVDRLYVEAFRNNLPGKGNWRIGNVQAATAEMTNDVTDQPDVNVTLFWVHTE